MISTMHHPYPRIDTKRGVPHNQGRIRPDQWHRATACAAATGINVPPHRWEPPSPGVALDTVELLLRSGCAASVSSSGGLCWICAQLVRQMLRTIISLCVIVVDPCVYIWYVPPRCRIWKLNFRVELVFV